MDDEKQIGARLMQEVARTIWRLQFVPADVEVSATLTTGRMDDGTEIEVIVRGVKHHA